MFTNLSKRVLKSLAIILKNNLRKTKCVPIELETLFENNWQVSPMPSRSNSLNGICEYVLKYVQNIEKISNAPNLEVNHS